MFSIECMRMRGFRKQYWISWKPLISWLLTAYVVDLDNFRFIQVDFCCREWNLINIEIGFRKFWWISWISIFRPTVLLLLFWQNSCRREYFIPCITRVMMFVDCCRPLVYLTSWLSASTSLQHTVKLFHFPSINGDLIGEGYLELIENLKKISNALRCVIVCINYVILSASKIQLMTRSCWWIATNFRKALCWNGDSKLPRYWVTLTFDLAFHWALPFAERNLNLNAKVRT